MDAGWPGACRRVLVVTLAVVAAAGALAVVGGRRATASTLRPAAAGSCPAPATHPVPSPPVAVAATADGCGYWVATAAGGVASFGTAPPLGGLSGPLDQPVVGMAAVPGGGGYWLVAADGGIFSFGDAAFYGSMGGKPLDQPVVGMAAVPGGGGYWLVAADGGIFSFGDAAFYGSMGGHPLLRGVVAMEATPSGHGYLMLAADGGVFTFGDASFEGTAPGPVLAGTRVTIDPGHNGGNFAAPGIIDQLVWNGRSFETCDTTGTATDTGYTEAEFNWNVARYLQADLEAEGADVLLTRSSNSGVGPCVTQRAAIGNAFDSDAAVSIHADGGPPYGRGFTVLEPVADGVNDAIVGPSAVLGSSIRDAIVASGVEPVSTYDGVDGIQPRNDLAGTNLSTVPKVFVECANMRNALDASLLVQPSWQQAMARAIASGITAFLATRSAVH